jgi:hypothetical protein
VVVSGPGLEALPLILTPNPLKELPALDLAPPSPPRPLFIEKPELDGYCILSISSIDTRTGVELSIDSWFVAIEPSEGETDNLRGTGAGARGELGAKGEFRGKEERRGELMGELGFRRGRVMVSRRGDSAAGIAGH